MPSSISIAEAIAKGVGDSMPYASEIADAIYQAHKGE
jgi:hypothetical protein